MIRLASVWVHAHPAMPRLCRVPRRPLRRWNGSRSPGRSSRETVFASWGPIAARRGVGRGRPVDLRHSRVRPGNGIQREAYETFQRAHHEWQTLSGTGCRTGCNTCCGPPTRSVAYRRARGPGKPLRYPVLLRIHVPRCRAARASASGPQRRVLAWGGDRVPGDRSWSRVVSRIRVSSSESMLPAQGWVQFHVDRNLPAALWAFSSMPICPTIPGSPAPAPCSRSAAIALPRPSSCCAPPFNSIPIRPGSRHAWPGRCTWPETPAKASNRSGSILVQFPEHEGTNLYGAMILAFNGEPERATGLAQDLAQRLPYFDLATAVHAYALACAGQ